MGEPNELAVIKKQTLTDIADAIRSRDGTTDAILPSEMPDRIEALPKETIDDHWHKPDAWPDLHDIIDAYPAPADAPNKTAILVSNVDGIFTILANTNFKYFRCSDNPDVLNAKGSSNTDYEFSSYIPVDGFSYEGVGWIIVYSNGDNVFQSPGGVTPWTASILWVVTKSNIVAYFRFCINLICVDGPIQFSQYSFSNCSSLIEIRGNPTLRTGASPSYMFEYCTALKYLPTFTISDEANCTSLFNGCYNLRRIPIHRIKPITYTSMFSLCRSVRELPDEIDIRGATNTPTGGTNDITYVDRSSITKFPTHFYADKSVWFFFGGQYAFTKESRHSFAEFDSGGNIVGGMVYNINSVSGLTFTTKSTYKAWFTEAEANTIATMMTSKGWTLVW